MLSAERGSCRAKLVRGRGIPIAKLSPSGTTYLFFVRKTAYTRVS
ncbi:MAG: hypothetical protein QOD84_2410 [Acidobacteriaceae bacterium]|jgi:hypothetical protein